MFAQDEFIGRLNRIMEARSVPAYKVAEDSGISAGALSLIRSGKRMPSLTTACAIAEALGVRVGWLAIGEI